MKIFSNLLQKNKVSNIFSIHLLSADFYLYLCKRAKAELVLKQKKT